MQAADLNHFTFAVLFVFCALPGSRNWLVLSLKQVWSKMKACLLLLSLLHLSLEETGQRNEAPERWNHQETHAFPDRDSGWPVQSGAATFILKGLNGLKGVSWTLKLTPWICSNKGHRNVFSPFHLNGAWWRTAVSHERSVYIRMCLRKGHPSCAGKSISNQSHGNSIQIYNTNPVLSSTLWFERHSARDSKETGCNFNKVHVILQLWVQLRASIGSPLLSKTGATWETSVWGMLCLSSEYIYKREIQTQRHSGFIQVVQGYNLSRSRVNCRVHTPSCHT